MRLQITISILLIFILLNISSVHSTTFTCSNTADWKTLADHNYDFYSSRIKPDASPAYSLTSAQQLNTFYESGNYAIVAVPDSECYAQKTCPPGIANNPSDWNQAGCSCSHFPQTGCGRTTWQVENHPTLVSGGVGTSMPPFPDPTYPSSWNERAVYTHTFAADTTDATISLNITGNLNTEYLPGGSTATATKCSDGATTIGGAEVIVKYFLVNGLSTFDQSFDNWYTPYDVREDWGLCGEVHQYWTEGPHKMVTRPAASNAIPVIAYVSPSSNQYDYSDRELGCVAPYSYRGDFIDQNQACAHYINSGITSHTDCPEGYTYSGGSFGAAASCRQFVRAEYSACPEGSEIDPVNANQCRTEQTFVPPPTDTPDPEETYVENTEETTGPGPGSGGGNSDSGSGDSDSDSGSGSGDSGSGDGNSDSGSGDSGDSGDSGSGGSDSGSRDFTTAGFYVPTYGVDTTLQSFLETQISGWDTTTLKSRLMTLVPTITQTGLPEICFDFSFTTTDSCVDFQTYSSVFDVLKYFFYFLSGLAAYRIIIGAR